MFCIECGSDSVTFLGAGSKFIAIDHYQCWSCDCDFIMKRGKKSPAAATDRRKSDECIIVHAAKPPLPSGSTN